MYIARVEQSVGIGFRVWSILYLCLAESCETQCSEGDKAEWMEMEGPESEYGKQRPDGAFSPDGRGRS